MYVGYRVGKLTVVSYIGKEYIGGRYRHRYLCKCDCGNTCIVSKDNLYGNTKSCGCSFKNYADEKFDRRSREKLYYIYKAIKQRCLNPKNKKYPDYGGRGITISDEWLGKKGYENFKSWAYQNGYDESKTFHRKCTIDRIDNNGNYSPNNCRFTDNQTQSGNRRDTRHIEWSGETHNITEWERLMSYPSGTIRRRLKSGWSVEDALNIPVGQIFNYKKGLRK